MIFLQVSLRKYHSRLLRQTRKIGTSTTLLRQPEKAERLIVGYSTRQHLLLDLDKSHSTHSTIRLIKMIQKDWPCVGDCLISESSWDGFHCIFDDKLSWFKIMEICRVLQGLKILNRDYIKVRTFREDLTVRVSSIDRGEEKSEAPIPKIMLLSPDSPDKPQTLTCSEMIQDYLDGTHVGFSGICDYLLALSAFRPLSSLTVQIL